MCFGATTSGDAFDAFLLSIKDDASLDGLRFVARNFLLDEGIHSSRSSSYEAMGAKTAHATFNDWAKFHVKYLDKHIHLKRPDSLPNQIDVTTTDACPETFRNHDPSSSFGSSDTDLYLVRVERVDSIASRAGLAPNELLDLLQQVELANSAGTASATAIKTKEELNSIFQLWGRSLDLRPIWACFWEYLADLFEPKSGADPDAWADELRNRLGLYHMNPVARKIPELPIIVLRYPVSSLPHLTGNKDSKPIAVPTVLDGRFNEAFCPVPRGQRHGFAIDLGKGPDYQPQREILHPAIQFKAEHVFKVGRIKQAPPEELAVARSIHLLWLRSEMNRVDYSVATDGD